MSNLTLIATALCAAAITASAQTAEGPKSSDLKPSSDVLEREEESNIFDFKSEVSFYSAYVWRGRVICNRPVWQPAQDIYINLGDDGEYGKLKTRLWASLYLTHDRYPRQYGGMHIFDATQSYMKNFGNLDTEIGHIWYTFPQKKRQGARSTDELFIGAQYRNSILTPRAYLWWDYSDKGRNERDMLFLDLQVSHNFKLTDKLSLDALTGFGVGNGPYMRSYTKGTVDTYDFNYFHSDLGLSYKVTDNISLGCSLSCFYNVSHEVRHSNYNLRDDNKPYVRGGAHLAVKF